MSRKVKCNLCDNDVQHHQFNNHLINKHDISIEKYVALFGEFREYKKEEQILFPEVNYLVCKLCGFKSKSSTERNRHLKSDHNLTYEQYIVNIYFNDIHPICKCGKCTLEMTFRPFDVGIWFKEFQKNHWPHELHTDDTKKRIKETYKKTMNDRYGVDNPMCLKIMRDKIKDTKEERYGDPNFNNKEKNKQTKKERYENENYNNPEQIKSTNQERYNANCFVATEEGKRQKQQTLNERYGVNNPMSFSGIKNKVYSTKLDRYGYKCEFENPEYRKKYNGKTSKIEKYVAEQLNAEHKFIYENKEFDIKIGNDIIEIDGNYWHPTNLVDLSFSQLNTIINDSRKGKSIHASNFNLIKIFIDNLPEEITIENIKNNSYIPNYLITFDQKIMFANYFSAYKEKKGEIKLKKYVSLLLDFLREMHPQFPFPPQKENIQDVILKINNYKFDKIYSETDKTFNNNSSVLGINYLKSNFKSYWSSAYKNNKTPIEAWNDDETMRKIIEYRIGLNNSGEVFDFSLHQMLRGLSAARYCVSFFKPVLAASIYEKLLEDLHITVSNPTVLDPCAGFGGRLLGFKSRYPEGTYIGIEPNKDTFDELNLLVDNANFKNVQLYNCKFEDFDITNIEYDLAFTSIPYYDTEKYSQHILYDSFEHWQNEFILSFFRLKNCFLNINQNICNKLGFLDKIRYQIKSNNSHFNKGSENKEVIVLM